MNENQAVSSSNTTILIADYGKASLVMSSEVFKDKIPGARVLVAASGKDCIQLANAEKPDMILVDFDLPDADGASLVTELRKNFFGPIVLTAYPSREVDQLVRSELFAWDDCGSVISKPLRIEELNERIDRFLIQRLRTCRRFTTSFPIEIKKKSTGKGVRTPKIQATVTNLSLGGVSCEMTLPIKFLMKDDLQIVLPKTLARFKKKGNAKVAAKMIAPTAADSILIKASLAWQNKKAIGFRFDKIPDKAREALESILRELAAP